MDRRRNTRESAMQAINLNTTNFLITNTATREQALLANPVATAIIGAMWSADAKSACVDAVVANSAKAHHLAAAALNEALGLVCRLQTQDSALVVALAAALGGVGRDSCHEFFPLSEKRRLNQMRVALSAAAEQLADWR